MGRLLCNPNLHARWYTVCLGSAFNWVFIILKQGMSVTVSCICYIPFPASASDNMPAWPGMNTESQSENLTVCWGNYIIDGSPSQTTGPRFRLAHHQVTWLASTLSTGSLALPTPSPHPHFPQHSLQACRCNAGLPTSIVISPFMPELFSCHATFKIHDHYIHSCCLNPGSWDETHSTSACKTDCPDWALFL